MPQASRFTVEIPVLETPRLRMRRHQLEDFPECARMWSDPSVTRYIRETPFSEEETWTRLLRFVGHWALLGFGYWAVEDKATGAYIGEVGFGDYHRDLKPSLKGMPEIGWVLAAHAHGRGFATEAVRAASAWGDSHFTGKRTACIISPENAGSIRVAMKCGYTEWERTTYHGHPAVLYLRDPA